MTAAGDRPKSYVFGTSDVPLEYLTIGEALDRSARQWPAKQALVVPGQNVRWSFRELNARADEVAAGLLALGLEVGDRLAVWAPNSAEWALIQFACAKAGLILVSVNPAYGVRELEYVLRKSGAKALVAAQKFKSNDYHSMLREIIPELSASMPGAVEAANLPALRHVIHIGWPVRPGCRSFEELSSFATTQSRVALERLKAVVQPDDPVNIQFTSGTTGTPKGATLSHFSILNNACFIGRRLGLSELDRVCMCLPLFHCSGIAQNLFSIALGCTLVYPSEWFEPGAVLETIQTERCTMLGGVPTMFIAELARQRSHRYDLSSLRKGFIGGSLPPEDVIRRIVAELGIRDLAVLYGMTETSPVSFQSMLDAPPATLARTAGKIHPHLEAKIVDNDGHVVPCGTPGEILTRGYSVMLGYWEEEAQTKEAVDAGRWMHTGDLGILDDEGALQIVGRVKDMIIRGGENIYPAEVENFLHEHEAIDDAYVFGLPDPRWGEEVCAWIRVASGRRLTEEDVREYCRGRIARYKVPKYIRFVDAFPLTATGKAQKFLMRRMMMEREQASPGATYQAEQA